MHKKTYYRYTGETLELSDLEWLQSIGVEVSLLRDRIEVDLSLNKYMVAGNSRIQLITTTPEQDTMLRLKYSDLIYFTYQTIEDEHGGS